MEMNEAKPLLMQLMQLLQRVSPAAIRLSLLTDGIMVAMMVPAIASVRNDYSGA